MVARSQRVHYAAGMALRELLATSRPVIFDGAAGTYLQERGLDDGAPGELWNVERPGEVEALHRAYAEAGARVLTTNTFGGTAPRLALHGLQDRVRELNLAGAAASRGAWRTSSVRSWPGTSGRPVSCWSRSARSRTSRRSTIFRSRSPRCTRAGPTSC